MSSLTETFRETLQNLSDEELVALASRSPAIHFATCVRIINKRNEWEEPVPNMLQLRMSQVYEVCQELGVPCRMIVCKPRQVGGSSFAAHIVYCHSQRMRTNGITISDKADNSRKLMRKVRDYAKHDRFPWGNVLRDTAKGLDWSNGSHWEIDSAENWKAGIGDTRQAFHASEVGKWPKSGIKNDKRVMAAVLPSISKLGASVVIAESTPEGANGWMYETYTREAVTLEEFLEMHRKGEQRVVWIKVFAAWYEFAEHQRSVNAAEEKAILRTLSPREREGMESHGWTIEQIAWRRDMISTECGGNEDTFDEYYPEDDVRCWSVAGRPRFHMGMLMQMERAARARRAEYGDLVRQENGEVSFLPSLEDNGEIQVWEAPREGLRYLVACDPATGESQTTGKDPDRTSIQVWRQAYYDGRIERPAMLVARVRAPFFGDADIVAGHLLDLSQWYGGCLIVPEVNMGLHIVTLLQLAGAPVYKRRVPSARVGRTVEQYGFKLTDREQRRQIVEALATAIREGAIDVPCPHWIEEAKNFITTQSGRDEARPGTHDDDTLCGGMAWLTLPSASEFVRKTRRTRKPADARNWKTVGRGAR